MYEEEKQEVQGLEKASDEIKMAVEGKQSILSQGLVNLSISSKNDLIKISIETPEGKERVKNDVVCVLDISGSMATEAHVKNTDGDKERHGLSYLDLLKHAVKTIIKNLNEGDRFGLISYSDNARVEFPLQSMSEENRDLAILATESLQDEGCTNIWAGVSEGLELLRKSQIDGQHQSIMLLTDGEPNIFPPAGLVPQFQKYKDTHPDFHFNLNTFAFGKRIDTPLLDQYAMVGNGQYSFIPCPGFIGTIFVNSISNILSTMGSQCTLEVEMQNGNCLESIPGGFVVSKQGKKRIINVGDLKFGQSRDVVLKIKRSEKKDQPVLNLTLHYKDYVGNKHRVGEVKDYHIPDWSDSFVDRHYCRVHFVDEVRQALAQMKSGHHKAAQQIVKDLSNEFAQILKNLEKEEQEVEMKDDDPNQEFKLARIQMAIDFIQSIKKDVDGEVTLAVGRVESFNHWGKHFLPSLCHAHLKQQCNNFCDPGIQKYGGKFFQTIKDQVEQTFLKMPAPVPSKKKPEFDDQQQQQLRQIQKLSVCNNNNNNNNNVAKPQPPPQQPQQNNNIDMGDYYNCGGGGCFAGDCLVKMANGELKKVKEVVKGDLVKGRNGEVNKVQLAVKINNDLSLHKLMPLVQLKGGLQITPKHPIVVDGQWVKPFEIQEPKVMACECVYNFVLEKGHTMEINGVYCVTFGHGFKGEKVAHPYFGTERIVDDLKQFQKEFESGFVEIGMKQFQRNKSEKQVCGIVVSTLKNKCTA